MAYIKRNLAFILFFVLCLFTAYAIGRAGGGGGGGHGGGGSFSGGRGHGGTSDWSPLLIAAGAGWLLYTIIISILMFVRTGVTNRLLAKISRQDRMWDPDLLRENARASFYKLQTAWQDRNMDKVRSLVTKKLYKNYTAQLEDMRRRRERNIISDISIFEIRIISCKDFKDNEKDRYVAHIRGRLLDYTINDQTKHILKNQEQESEDFEDAYYFIRSGNTWLLEEINNDPGFWVLLDAGSHSET